MASSLYCDVSLPVPLDQAFTYALPETLRHRVRAGCRVLVHEHLDGTQTIRYGPHVVGRYNAQGWPLLEQSKPRRRKAVEKPLRGKPQAGFPLRLEIPQHRRDFHFPTARTAAKDQP